jgi:hypothetical protein
VPVLVFTRSCVYYTNPILWNSVSGIIFLELSMLHPVLGPVFVCILLYGRSCICPIPQQEWCQNGDCSMLYQKLCLLYLLLGTVLAVSYTMI